MTFSELKKYIDDNLDTDQLDKPVVLFIDGQFYEPNLITVVEFNGASDEEYGYPAGQPIIS